MTGKRNAKTNLKNIVENKDTIYSPTVILQTFNIKFVNFATTVEGPTTQMLIESYKNIDNNYDNMFAFPTNLSEVFIRVGNLKIN